MLKVTQSKCPNVNWRVPCLSYWAYLLIYGSIGHFIFPIIRTTGQWVILIIRCRKKLWYIKIMHGTFVRVNAVHKYRDPRLCFPPTNCQGVSISGSAAHQPTSMGCSFNGLLSWPFDGHEMPFRREVHVFLWLSLSLYGARALEESTFMPCAQEGFAHPEPVQRCPARASMCWLPLCFPSSASGVLFFLSVPLTPGTVLSWAAFCEPSMGCEVAWLVAWGCIHPFLSPLHLSCSNLIFQGNRSLAVPWGIHPLEVTLSRAGWRASESPLGSLSDGLVWMAGALFPLSNRHFQDHLYYCGVSL